MLTSRAIVDIPHNPFHSSTASTMRSRLQAIPSVYKVRLGQTLIQIRGIAVIHQSLAKVAGDTLILGHAALVVQREVGKWPVSHAPLRACSIAAEAVDRVKDLQVGEIFLVGYLVPVWLCACVVAFRLEEALVYGHEVSVPG